MILTGTIKKFKTEYYLDSELRGLFPKILFEFEYLKETSKGYEYETIYCHHNLDSLQYRKLTEDEEEYFFEKLKKEIELNKKINMSVEILFDSDKPMINYKNKKYFNVKEMR